MEYGNMFFNYRIASVWSAPEVLKQMKKMVELTPQMDTYSFGMIIWELWHMSIPFDNDIKLAEEYVVKEESRPKINDGANNQDSDDNLDDEQNEEQFHTAKSNTILDNVDINQSQIRTKPESNVCDPII